MLTMLSMFQKTQYYFSFPDLMSLPSSWPSPQSASTTGTAWLSIVRREQCGRGSGAPLRHVQRAVWSAARAVAKSLAGSRPARSLGCCWRERQPHRTQEAFRPKGGLTAGPMLPARLAACLHGIEAWPVHFLMIEQITVPR